MTRASAIVRCKDKADTIERTLRSLRAQTVPVEIVVVDSGSTDGTLEIARRHADRIVEIPADSFSFGGALNSGAEAADGDVHFALSAHCEAEREDWVERALAHYERPEVAATNGGLARWDGRPLIEPVDQTRDVLHENPYWGFSNHASSWRASVWESHRFDESLDSTEDKEWAWRVIEAGHVIVFDPFLTVDALHRKQAGTRALFRRVRGEGRALASVVDLPERTLRDVRREWWNDLPEQSMSPPLFHRVNWLRSAEILGRYVGEREGARRRRSRPAPPAGTVPVSVVIPAYNRPEMVTRAVRSALGQSGLRPAEVIVVDDCSTDGTAEAASAAGARVIRHERNQGEGGSRNTGIRAAEHPWVALLDSDDEWLPHHLSVLWPMREERVLVSASCQARGDGPDDGRIQGPGTREPVDLRSPAQLAHPMNFVPPSAVMLRRDAVVAAGGFDPGLERGADLDLWLRMLERGRGIASPEVTGIYHVHGGQVSDDKAAMEDAHLEIVRAYETRPWCSPALLRRREGVSAWDSFRRRAAAGDRARGVLGLAGALSDPRRLGGLAGALRQRRRIRRQQARISASSSTPAVS